MGSLILSIVCCHEKLCGFAAFTCVGSLKDAIFLLNILLVALRVFEVSEETPRNPSLNAIVRGTKVNANTDSAFADSSFIY